MDAFGTNDGGCYRQHDPSWDRFVRQAEYHLNGDYPMGVYPIVTRRVVQLGVRPGNVTLPPEEHDQWYVKWGCSDIDVDDEPLAWNLRAVLDALGITAWVERSRSKGFHVWVFADGWVPAATMRRALLAVHQIADIPAKEVNPKQEQLADGQLGNYVRLPYPGWLTVGDTMRQVILGALTHETIPLDIFVEMAMERRASLKVLERSAELYVPPAPKQTVNWNAVGFSDVDDILPRLSGLAYTIWRDGPLDGRDRSGTLVKLAHKCADSGITAYEALRILTDADMRWGKFSERADCEAQLMRMVEQAYG